MMQRLPRIAYVGGVLFFSLWLLTSLLLVFDLALTGAVEWSPWAQLEALDPFEFGMAYLFSVVVGASGLLLAVRGLRGSAWEI